MTIYVTRHGQSMTNIDADIGAKHKVNLKNNILTEIGIQQAMDYAKNIKAKDIEIEEIHCSPLARTKQTAFTIASVLGTLVPIHYKPVFREIEWDIGGKFDRLENYIPDFDSKNLKVNERPLIDHKRGVITLESQEDVYNRVIPAFVRLAQKTKKKNKLIVTHFFVSRAIMAFMAEGTSEAMLGYSPTNLCDLSYDNEAIIEQAKKSGII